MIELKEGDVYEGQIEFSTNGNASLVINEKEIFVYKKNTANSLHLDKVKVQIFKAEKKLEGKVIEVISRFKTEFVGKVQIGKKTIFVVPDSNKISVDFYIKGGLKAENDQKVVVELIKWEDTKSDAFSAPCRSGNMDIQGVIRKCPVGQGSGSQSYRFGKNSVFLPIPWGRREQILHANFPDLAKVGRAKNPRPSSRRAGEAAGEINLRLEPALAEFNAEQRSPAASWLHLKQLTEPHPK